jgi:hypothetical protein
MKFVFALKINSKKRKKSILSLRAEPVGSTRPHLLRSGPTGPAEAHRPGEATARPAPPPGGVSAQGSCPRPIKAAPEPRTRGCALACASPQLAAAALLRTGAPPLLEPEPAGGVDFDSRPLPPTPAEGKQLHKFSLSASDS